MQLPHDSHSDASSDTNLGDVQPVENPGKHESHHARFGDNNQVFTPNDSDTLDMPETEKVGTNDKIELTEDMCYDELGFSFPEWKKW